MSLDQHTFEKLWNMAQAVCEQHNCLVYDIEFSGSATGRILRLYIDKDEAGGINLQDCSNVSHGLNELLDVDDLVPGAAYNLEVSSPGLERKLRTPMHFRRSVGQEITIKVSVPLAERNVDLADKLGKRKQLEALLVAAEDSFIVCEFEKMSIKVPYEDIEKASVLFRLPDEGEKKKDLSPKKKSNKNKKRA